ncbi:MAG: PsiF family protein [Moraxellaceae bacterium]|nr:PsiF family protein [Moraxellaceae bacterium]
MDNNMKKSVLQGTALAILLSSMMAGPAVATANDARYVRNDCTEQAADKAGEERRQAIAKCVRNKARSNNVPPMLAKVSECNRKAGDLAGDARSTFMNECMKDD